MKHETPNDPPQTAQTADAPNSQELIAVILARGRLGCLGAGKGGVRSKERKGPRSENLDNEGEKKTVKAACFTRG